MSNNHNLQQELHGRNALVTGGSGDIGSAIVLALARRGANIAIHYYMNKKNAEYLRQMVISFGRKCVIVQGDLTVKDDIVRVVKESSALGTIEILINNAGTPIQRIHWMELKADFLDQVFALNYRAPLYFIQQVAPHMIKQGQGVIINILSVAAHTGGTDTVFAYGSSKGALLSLTRGLARSLASKGVRVIAISPGTIDTKIQRKLTDSSLLQQIVDDIPIGRIGRPEEVGEIVAYLATDSASYIVGAMIEVNGGVYM